MKVVQDILVEKCRQNIQKCTKSVLPILDHVLIVPLGFSENSPLSVRRCRGGAKGGTEKVRSFVTFLR